MVFKQVRYAFEIYVMKYSNYSNGRGLAVLFMLVLGLSLLPVELAFYISTGQDLGRSLVACTVSFPNRLFAGAAVVSFELLIWTLIGYRYFRAKGEGPFGPIRKHRAGESKIRQRLFPYVSNGLLPCMVFLPFVVLFNDCLVGQ